MRDWFSDVFRGRPVWMNAALVFCAYMTFVYVPWDFLWKPAAHDQEVWFGIQFTGATAKLLEIPHWIVYALLTYGIRRMRPWAGTFAALYSAQIAIGMFVWNLVYLEGWLLPLFVGTIGAIPFALLAGAFWSAEEFRELRSNLRERYGEWGLVTGASSGIGMEFARALARDHVNLVLAARRDDRLRELATELEQDRSIQTRVVAVDLSTEAGADELADAVRDLQISILVNNAGAGYAGRFDLQDPVRVRQLITTNCVAPAVLTARLLPGMHARGSGAVVFTGSVAGRQPLPLHAVYSASKAFDNYLGEALYIEARGSGVDVLVVEPGSTATEFQSVAGENAHPGAPASRVVEIALDALGKQPSVVSGWLNYVRALLAERVPSRPLRLYLARDIMKQQTPSELR
ncbi:MAG: SDR family NAD(P)-dependent oxidoreductase [Myxococcota bacterium]|nr:SDR family NAD(P)-dependent oxidoreductase [Myxococcota bacterium]